MDAVERHDIEKIGDIYSMNNKELQKVKSLIDKAKVVSFDVFDTLLFRKVNTPEDIFTLLGDKYKIYNFRSMRTQFQNKAGIQVREKYGYPHADINEIYRYIAENSPNSGIKWNEVKESEIALEQDSLVANNDILDVFDYAKSQGKRIVATTDMYLLADTILAILTQKGFKGFDHIYCSADEHKAKFNGELFDYVKEMENVEYNEIFHIGDNYASDVKIPADKGIVVFQYIKKSGAGKYENTSDTCIDRGLSKILYDEDKGFWYNLGIEVGGPLYMGAVTWLLDKISGEKIFFLARDGYNMYNVFREMEIPNVEYLYISRRALILAGITEMTKEDIDELPPYTTGQTVKEILDYLCIPYEKIKSLSIVGFKDINDRILTYEDIQKFKELYTYDKTVFLERCEIERKNAVSYFKRMGVFDSNAVMFDCGWSGSSQYLFEKLKKAVGAKISNKFYYFGITNTAKSHRQLRGLHYEAYLDEYITNKYVREHEAMFELFFSAPHEATFYYDENGPVFEEKSFEQEKEQIAAGIEKFLENGLEYVRTNNIKYSNEEAISHLIRLITNPTEEEAKTIGDLNNVDSFTKIEGKKVYMAYVEEEDIIEGQIPNIFWVEGLLTRIDVSEDVKREVARNRGIEYPKKERCEYHLECLAELENYSFWREDNLGSAELKELEYNPKFSFVMPVYNTASNHLTEAIESVLNQTYKNFELILVDDNSSWANVRPLLQKYEKRDNVTVIYRKENGHISECTNTGLKQINGDFVAFMDCDDVIERNTLYEFALKLNENSELDFIYSDEDKLSEDGRVYHLPFYKPDWSPDLFMTIMYTNHLAVYRTEIVKKVGGLRSETNGAQDYDFTLRFMEITTNDRVGHIPQILYHWRERKESIAFSAASKSYATEATRIAKEDALSRRKIDGYEEYMPALAQYRTIYNVNGEPKVSIIIPSKDHVEILFKCIDSIIEFTNYKNYEIIVVDNGSNDANRNIIQKFLNKIDGIYLYGEYEFNFSKMCNLGADVASGEFLLFLNDDIEIVQYQWLERMLGQAQLEYVGAVGAKLLYPDTTLIQHSGVSNIKEGPSHDFLKYDDSIPHFYGFNWINRNCIGVTGACLLVEKQKFIRAGRFDEEFPVAYNDIDLCYRLYEAKLYNVIRNDVIAYHHESLSRGVDDFDEKKMKRLQHDYNKLYVRHDRLKGKDPFLNSNLHTNGYPLDLYLRPRDIEITSLLGAVVKGKGVLETAITSATRQIRITGWALIENVSELDIKARYLIVSSPFGYDLRIKVSDVPRIDLYEAYNKDVSKIHSGFITIVDEMDVCFDLLACRMGIEFVTQQGKRYYCALAKSHNLSEQQEIQTMLDFCQNSEDVYIYGAGVYGKQCLNELGLHGIKPKNFVVSKLGIDTNSINGIEIISFEQLNTIVDKSKVKLIVALKPMYRNEVLPNLKRNGFQNIITYPFNI